LKKWIVRGLAGLVIVLLAAGAAAAVLLRHALNDDSVPRTAELLAPGAPKTVLAVWAHPDDEVTSAGTLARLSRSGARVVIVYFTSGEAAKVPGWNAEQLHAARPGEAQAAGRALGAAKVVVLDYGDSKLPAADGDKARAELKALIETEKPSTVISFDENVGFYGHLDHAQVGRWTAQVVREGASDPNFPVQRLYQATLPAPAIALARQYIAAFRNNYPTDPAKGLPAPTLAVPIAGEGGAKRAVLDAHKSQVSIIDDVQPYGRKLPAWLYYRILDREYFALAYSR
jgi:LmbE family N-acetylglucosaminyl deacetylase